MHTAHKQPTSKWLKSVTIFLQGGSYEADVGESPPGQGPQGVDVETWLEDFTDGPMKEELIGKFRKYGFDNTVYISGMNERELRDMGIKDKIFLYRLMEKIEELEIFDIDAGIPQRSVDDWLETVGLPQYKENFKKLPKIEHLAALRSFSRKNIRRDLNIEKAGHIKRLQYAIEQLRKPNKAEDDEREAKRIIHEKARQELEDDEKKFFEKLVTEKLNPKWDSFGMEGDLHGKLGKLRNTWLAILAVANAFWLVVIITLASKSDLVLLGANPLGLLFLVLFSLVFAVQFVCMLLHRLYSLGHWLASADYSCSCCKCCTTSASNSGSCCLSIQSCCCCLQSHCHDPSYTPLSNEPEEEGQAHGGEKTREEGIPHSSQKSSPEDATPSSHGDGRMMTSTLDTRV